MISHRLILVLVALTVLWALFLRWPLGRGHRFAFIEVGRSPACWLIVGVWNHHWRVAPLRSGLELADTYLARDTHWFMCQWCYKLGKKDKD